MATNKAFRDGSNSTPVDTSVVDSIGLTFSTRGLPSAEEIQGFTHQYIKTHYPKLLRNDLEQYFDVLKYEIIYTPPYCPKFQPIERVWGWSKNFVAELWFSGRKLDETYAQMVAVWYGGIPLKAGKEYTRQGQTGLSRRLVGDFIRQCQMHMDEWIVANGLRCSGSIRDPSNNPFKYDSSLHYLNDGSLLNVEDDIDDEDFDDTNEGEE